jgi:hypothetical protein
MQQQEIETAEYILCFSLCILLDHFSLCFENPDNVKKNHVLSYEV